MKLINKHIEWVVFLSGLIILSKMDPAIYGTSFCIFDFLGLPFCLGEGLGHSIAYFLNGNVSASIETHFMGPIAVIILSYRLLTIWKNLIIKKNDLQELNYV